VFEEGDTAQMLYYLTSPQVRYFERERERERREREKREHWSTQGFYKHTLNLLKPG
jgi:hypothetical protein